MAVIGGIFGKSHKRDGEYIDLAEEVGGKEETEPMMYVKVAELQNYEDLKDFTDYVYNGDIYYANKNNKSSQNYGPIKEKTSKVSENRKLKEIADQNN